LAVQEFGAVFVQPFGLLHPHVHGHVPLTIVGLPVAQVAVGRTYELNATLHDPFIQAALALLHDVAVVLVHPLIPEHPQVLVVEHEISPLSDPVE
jgi:hypothetical protein